MTDQAVLVELLRESDELHRDADPSLFRSRPARDEEYVAQLLNEAEGTVLVAELDGQVIGLVQLAIKTFAGHPLMAARTYAHIGDIVVRQQHRRSGSGRILMEAAERWAAEHGATDIELHVWEFNAGARDFYDSVGYSTRGRMMSRSLT